MVFEQSCSVGFEHLGPVKVISVHGRDVDLEDHPLRPLSSRAILQLCDSPPWLFDVHCGYQDTSGCSYRWGSLQHLLWNGTGSVCCKQSCAAPVLVLEGRGRSWLCAAPSEQEQLLGAGQILPADLSVWSGWKSLSEVLLFWAPPGSSAEEVLCR